MNKTAKEFFIILSASILIGIIANSLSSKGIGLIRDDGNRYAIDTAAVKNEFDIKKRGKLNKAGFHEPVNIPVEAAKQLFDENAKFIDGREAFEFNEGRIKGAANIPYKEFKDKTIEEKMEIMKDLKKELIIVSYCSSDSCEMSIDNAYEMAKAGYNDVKIYLGGYKEWNKMGYPTEK
ncbi:MAG: rhodanese-like domain-containing protein [Bacteroidota bacterium]|nr:rhodanese-like domain-containing protein [Bacteroidota bacterium]